MKRLFAIILLSVLFPLLSWSQVTKVRGKLIDGETGEPIQAAAVFFQNTYIGTMTDRGGNFLVETKDTTLRVLSFKMIGYKDLDETINPGEENLLTLKLVPDYRNLSASVVKPDNHRILWLLSQIDKNAERNNPEKRPYYKCSLYNRMELDVVDPENNIGFTPIIHSLPYLKSHIDTSERGYRPILPALLSESFISRYHSTDPVFDKEVIENSRVSGFNDGNALSQLTGSLRQTLNFYDGFVHVADIEIPSPSAKGAELYYNHYIVDSLEVSGRKTYLVHYHPRKLVSQPCFDGEMEVDASDFALKAIRGQLHPGSDVNWVRTLSFDIESTRLPDSTWFYQSDSLRLEFSISDRDSLSVMAFVGRRNLRYMNPTFEPGASSGGVNFERPYPLNSREKNIYNMVDTVQHSRTYRFYYTMINMFATGYAEFGKIGIGPYTGLFGWNDTEGFRASLGLRTTKEFSRRYRLTGYAAYGTRDNALKGGFRIERVFANQPMRKVTISAKEDVVQLGRGMELQGSDMFSSLLSRGGGDRMSMARRFDLQYEHEFNANITQTVSFTSQRIYSNSFVLMATPQGTSLPFVSSSQVRLSTRFSWKETITRGVFDNQRIHTRFPIVTLDIYGAFKGLDRNSYSYLRPEVTVNYKVPTPPFGVMKLRLNAGHIFGTVPYPMLKIHEGNQTYVYDSKAFACLNYYEFVSDSWATLFYEQNFRGMLLGKIPLLKELDLREIFSMRVACGSLSDKNRNCICFPEGMSSLGTPYAEIGCGISNILKMFRVDAFWRLTHRYTEVSGTMVPSPDRFAFNVGMELNF